MRQIKFISIESTKAVNHSEPDFANDRTSGCLDLFLASYSSSQPELNVLSCLVYQQSPRVSSN